jgi:hypothetical protein
MDRTIALLQIIADNTSRDITVGVALISGIAALLGAAIGGIGGYLGARRSALSQERIEGARMRVNIITAERLRWLQDIRQRLSHLYVEMDMQYSFIKRPVAPGSAAATQAEHDAMSRKVMEQSHMITLMLNPENEQQAALRHALQEAQAFIMAAFRNYGREVERADETYLRIKQSAFDALTRIGSETWAKIKAEAGADAGA